MVARLISFQTRLRKERSFWSVARACAYGADDGPKPFAGLKAPDELAQTVAPAVLHPCGNADPFAPASASRKRPASDSHVVRNAPLEPRLSTTCTRISCPGLSTFWMGGYLRPAWFVLEVIFWVHFVDLQETCSCSRTGRRRLASWCRYC